MLDGVQYQMWAIEINEGDCIVSNHPCAGGVHLPVYSQVTAFLTLPGEFTSCSRTHNLHGNLADLRALVAANQKVSVFVTSQLYQSQTFQRSFLFRVSTWSRSSYREARHSISKGHPLW
ncbi:unnamed protein product [Clavelina lepadiformis]|uniref:Uncharacterized protein n=1 Tax=Clavelina lepadiformis TaxID=159417 RepID=A0ABP0G6D5_CLALP